MIKITARQEEVLHYIHRVAKKNGYPPTVREMMDGLHIGSIRGVTVHLDALKRKGYILRSPSSPRAIKFLPLALALLHAEKNITECLTTQAITALRAAEAAHAAFLTPTITIEQFTELSRIAGEQRAAVLKRADTLGYGEKL